MQTWYHIPTPGDHFSPATGSAVITVIYQMCRHHSGRSIVVVGNKTKRGYEVGELVDVRFRRTGPPARIEKMLDLLLGVGSGFRRLSGQRYRPAALKLGSDIEGNIFVYNEPSAVRVFVDHCPLSNVILWAQNDLFRTYTKRQVETVVKQCHSVICCSEYIRNGIVSRIGENAKVVTIRNGVDKTHFFPRSPSLKNHCPHVLFVGRLIPEKGPHILLEAVRQLTQQGLELKVLIVGRSGFTNANAPTRYELSLMEAASTMPGTVDFRGFVDRDEIADVYRSADIFCAPSDWNEPFALTVSEAIACGLHCVASNRGGIPDAAGGNAILVEGPTVESVKNGLLTAISRIGLPHSSIRNDRLFSWEDCYKEVWGLCHRL